MQSNDIQKQIDEKSNVFVFEVMSNINNGIAFFIPIFIFSFLFISASITKDILKVDFLLKGQMNGYIVISFIPILLGSLIFNGLFYSLRSDNLFKEGMSINEVMDLSAFGFFKFKYFKYVNIVLWVLYYICFTFLLTRISKVPLTMALGISLLPSIAVMILKQIFDLF